MKTALPQSAQQWGKQERQKSNLGLYHGSALRPLLFIIIRDVITEDVEEETPWAMLFADDW